jgi:hypothetical protein
MTWCLGRGAQLPSGTDSVQLMATCLAMWNWLFKGEEFTASLQTSSETHRISVGSLEVQRLEPEALGLTICEGSLEVQRPEPEALGLIECEGFLEVQQPERDALRSTEFAGSLEVQWPELEALRLRECEDFPWTHPNLQDVPITVRTTVSVNHTSKNLGQFHYWRWWQDLTTVFSNCALR